jgi:hypothetical protein
MNLAPISRRSFLRYSSKTAAITVALGASGCSFFTGKAVTKFETQFGTLLVLDATQANTFYAFAEAIIPKGSGFPDVKTAKVVERADEETSFTAKKIQIDVKAMLDIMEYLPIFHGEFSRFSKMTMDDRLTFLNSLHNTTNDMVRAVVNNCRMITFNMYYGHESTWQAVGYDGPFGKVPEKIGEQRQHYAKQVGGKLS